jgi:hypothetical protein
MTGWGRVRVEKQAMKGNDPHGGHEYVCEGDMAQCRGEEGKPWDGTDQTIVFQVAVSFPYACVEGVSMICLRSGQLLC